MGSPSLRMDLVVIGSVLEGGCERFSTQDADLVEGEASKDGGIELAFRLLNPGVEAFWSVVVENRHGLLAEDGAGVDSVIDEVDGAACELDAVVESLFPSFEPWEGREQGGVDINHTLPEMLEEIRFDDAHEAGEDDKIDLGLLERADKLLFGGFVELGAISAGGDEPGGDSEVTGAIEDPCLRDIAEHEGDRRGEGAGSALFGDGNHVGALARAEDTEPNGFGLNHVA